MSGVSDMSYKTGSALGIGRISGIIAMLSCLILYVAGCSTMQQVKSQPLSTQGELFVYLAPLAQDSDKIDFSIADIWAMQSDGTAIPLTLILDKPTKGAKSRQRLLARGELPPGEYSGISFRLKKATIETEDGLVSMLVSEQGEVSPLRFKIDRKIGMVIEASFSGNAARSTGFSLRPSFALKVPPPPLPSLTGYLSLPSGNRVVVFDKRSGAVGRSIATGATPSGVVFDPAGRRAFIALRGEDLIEVVDLAEHNVNHQIRLNAGDAPTEIAMARNGSILLVVNEESNTLSFLDPTGLREIGRVAIGFAPKGIAVDRNGNLACVCNNVTKSVSIIDIPSRQKVMELPTDPDPINCQFSSDSSRLLVGHQRTPYLFVYDLSKRAIQDRLTVFGGVSAIKVDNKSDRFFVASAFGGSLAIFNQTVQFPIDFIGASSVTSYLTIDGDENTMLAVQPNEGSLRIIDLISKSDRAVVDAGDPPFRVTVAGER